jgi:hypothetical protein
MAEITINGRRASRLRVLLPLAGAWVADAVVDDGTSLEGAVTVALDGLTLAGAVVRGGVGAEVWTGRIVGGAGGLRRALPATSHRNVTLRAVLDEALRASGESAADDIGDLSHAVTLYQRREAPALFTVADVARAAGYAWRVRPDGRVWMGAERWPAFAPTDVELVGWDDRTGTLRFSGSTLGILPGQTLTAGGRTVRILGVEHQADAERIRTTLATEPA